MNKISFLSKFLNSRDWIKSAIAQTKQNNIVSIFSNHKIYKDLLNKQAKQKSWTKFHSSLNVLQDWIKSAVTQTKLTKIRAHFLKSQDIKTYQISRQKMNKISFHSKFLKFSRLNKSAVEQTKHTKIGSIFSNHKI